jgi:hypothetical protein
MLLGVPFLPLPSVRKGSAPLVSSSWTASGVPSRAASISDVMLSAMERRKEEVRYAERRGI